MKTKYVTRSIMAFFLFATFLFTGCQVSKEAAGTEVEETTAEVKSMAPTRVDVRGSIITSRYNQGQVVLEVEGFPSTDTRFDRAYVLVQPTTQIIGTDGQVLSLNELGQGQNVAIKIRGNGEGNMVGVGVAQKVWLEDIF